MRVKAIKVDDGILIPFQEGLQDIKTKNFFLDIELIEALPQEEDYRALDTLVGFYETGDTDASIEHDQRIYRS